jgi:transposase-like protein
MSKSKTSTNKSKQLFPPANLVRNNLGILVVPRAEDAPSVEDYSGDTEVIPSSTSKLPAIIDCATYDESKPNFGQEPKKGKKAKAAKAKSKAPTKNAAKKAKPVSNRKPKATSDQMKEVVEQLKTRSVADVAKDYDLPEWKVQNWRRKLNGPTARKVKYTLEFKKEVLADLKKLGATPTKVAKARGLKLWQILAWRLAIEGPVAKD